MANGDYLVVRAVGIVLLVLGASAIASAQEPYETSPRSAVEELLPLPQSPPLPPLFDSPPPPDSGPPLQPFQFDSFDGMGSMGRFGEWERPVPPDQPYWRLAIERFGIPPNRLLVRP